MTTFFELPHVFVVFISGAGGNFISGILSNIFSNSSGDLKFSDSGNAHLNSTSKLNFTDVMSFGIRYRMPDFVSNDEKLKFYKAKIEEKHGNDTDIKVTWSHDFSNIQLYRKLFPNCKIVAVTQDSNAEKLATLIQQELKNRLDPAGFVFVTQEDLHMNTWKNQLFLILVNVLGAEHANLARRIADNYLDPEFRDIVTLFSVNLMIGFYDQRYLLDASKTPAINYLNYCTVPKFILDKNYTPGNTDAKVLVVGPRISDCLTEDSFIIPYSTLMNNDLEAFTRIIAEIYGQELNSNQIEFIKKNFNSYYSSQCPGLLQDPMEFHRSLRTKVHEQIKILKNNAHING